MCFRRQQTLLHHLVLHPTARCDELFQARMLVAEDDPLRPRVGQLAFASACHLSASDASPDRPRWQEESVACCAKRNAREVFVSWAARSAGVIFYSSLKVGAEVKPYRSYRVSVVDIYRWALNAGLARRSTRPRPATVSWDSSRSPPPRKPGGKRRPHPNRHLSRAVCTLLFRYTQKRGENAMATGQKTSEDESGVHQPAAAQVA